MEVKLIKFPTRQELDSVKAGALKTVGKRMVNEPTDGWLFRLADA